ncbi:uncharacterized protein TNCT_9201 [Trichonephila clavata]|uniref:Uncharacterized protein n=1 Tax=Trichonephila clavata TaxID=2740835 RepID=A0A8X6HVJ9_TRICU|nr:uncharacterized protein TNCT_9201 [Trichonephila clavata]
MRPSGNMARQTRLIAILLLSLESILAARILESANFGIISHNSDNFPEGEKFEVNGAKLLVESSSENILNILNESFTGIHGRTRGIIPESNRSTDPGNDENDATSSDINVTTNIPPEHTNTTASISNLQHRKMDRPLELHNMNENHKTGILPIWIRQYDEVSSTVFPVKDSEIISGLPNKANQTIEKNIKYISFRELVLTTENSARGPIAVTRGSDTNVLSGTIEPIGLSKLKKIIIPKEDIMNENVVKNIIEPKLTVNRKHESTSPKTASIEDKWLDLEKTFRFYTDSVMKKALPKFLRIHSQLNISSQCNGALLQMVSGLRKFKSWAIKNTWDSFKEAKSLAQKLDHFEAIKRVHKKPGLAKTWERRTYDKPSLESKNKLANFSGKGRNVGSLNRDSIRHEVSHGSSQIRREGLRDRRVNLKKGNP